MVSVSASCISHNAEGAYKGAIASSALRILNDSYIFYLTVMKTWRHVVESKKIGQSGVTHIFLRDGKSTVPIML